MDDADIAAEQAEREMTLALRRLDRSAPTRPPKYDGDWCLICGDEIPADRRAAMPGCCTCIVCQERLERGMGR